MLSLLALLAVLGCGRASLGLDSALFLALALAFLLGLLLLFALRWPPQPIILHVLRAVLDLQPWECQNMRETDGDIVSNLVPFHLHYNVSSQEKVLQLEPIPAFL